MEKNYDYIIAGAGCAGLSLLMRIMNDPFFTNKKIAVIESSFKNSNDRTWCFWEKKADIFEPIVHHQWTELDFYSSNYSDQIFIDPYVYKMIRGIDFYQFVIEKANRCSNIHWINASVISIKNIPKTNTAKVELNDRIIYADKVFNSILFEPIKISSKQFYFQQHFKGWMIKTDQPSFNPSKATFMDFRVSQHNGTTFMYVLPTSTTEALVEYTLFTENLIEQDEYDKALKKYITEDLRINNYQIEHEEYGIIPMTNAKFKRQEGSVIYIGIAGGQAKASSGYAFKFIQKRTAGIIEALRLGKPITSNKSFNNLKGLLYDSVLLNVLHAEKLGADKIFANIFKNNKAVDVLKFLDNESSLLIDLKIMNSVPTSIFLPAALREIFVSAVNK